MKQFNINHAIWMLSSAIQSLSSTLNAIERNDEVMTVEWLSHAVNCMRDAEEAIDDSKILPF